MQLFRRIAVSTVTVKVNEATKLAIGAHSRYRRHRAFVACSPPAPSVSDKQRFSAPRKSTDTSEDCRWNVTLIDVLQDGAWKQVMIHTTPAQHDALPSCRT
jgi:hypothetical protein